MKGKLRSIVLVIACVMLVATLTCMVVACGETPDMTDNGNQTTSNITDNGNQTLDNSSNPDTPPSDSQEVLKYEFDERNNRK